MKVSNYYMILLSGSNRLHLVLCLQSFQVSCIEHETLLTNSILRSQAEAITSHSFKILDLNC